MAQQEKPLRFGQRLTNRRQENDISIYSLAKQTGISHANLIAIEKGRRPASKEVMNRLVAVPELALTVEEMLAWKALDEYSTDIIRKALEVFKSSQPFNKCIRN